MIEDPEEEAWKEIEAKSQVAATPPALSTEYVKGWNAALDSAANQVAGMFGGEDTADSFAVFFRNMKV